MAGASRSRWTSATGRTVVLMHPASTTTFPGCMMRTRASSGSVVRKSSAPSRKISLVDGSGAAPVGPAPSAIHVLDTGAVFVVMAFAADYATVAKTIVYTQDNDDMDSLGEFFTHVALQRV